MKITLNFFDWENCLENAGRFAAFLIALVADLTFTFVGKVDVHCQAHFADAALKG